MASKEGTIQVWGAGLTAAALVLSTSGVGAQDQELLFPNETGEALADELRAGFTPIGPLEYGPARDTMFLRVWRTPEGQLIGQYSQFAIDLPDGVDPTIWAFDRGINTEHLWPQSKGAQGDARADMHHLYPTRVDVNADRGSLPFADIADATTQRWYLGATQLNEPPPTSERDEYSEGSSGAFEPREAIKGDVARAMMYFYTIWRERADDADASFWPRQRETLCRWSNEDPVDLVEYERTRAIERVQGQANPFVLDCTLPVRLAYCADPAPACEASSVTERGADARIEVYPNPAARGEQLRLRGFSGEGPLQLFDLRGGLVLELSAAERTGVAGQEEYVDLPTGLSSAGYVFFEPNSRRRSRLLFVAKAL